MTTLKAQILLVLAFLTIPAGLADGQRPGVHPGLQGRLAEDPAGAHDVVIWLRYDPKDVDFREDALARIAAGLPVAEAQAELAARVKEGNLRALRPGLQLLAGAGLPVLHADPYAPLILTRANRETIEWLAGAGCVDTVYAASTYSLHTGNPLGTHRWNRVFDFGVRGDGVQIAIVEQGAIAPDQDSLNVVGSMLPIGLVSPHATAVAGCAGSFHYGWPGHARGVQLLSANAPSMSEADLLAANAWAVAAGAEILNLSFGADLNRIMGPMDRQVDYYVRTLARTIVVSAGNNFAAPGQGGTGTGNVASPGTAWNVITVGNVSDAGTPMWSDDAVYWTSSSHDPVSPNQDRQKPELAAVGSDIITTQPGYVNLSVGSGTSFSAPAVAGMAACLMQVDPVLALWPEALKAILMASATHNVEGAAVLSDRDGAGCVNGLQAYRMVENRSYTGGVLDAGAFSNSGCFTQQVWLQSGDRTRIALVWDSNTNAAWTQNVLGANLNLSVYAGPVPAGNPVAFSWSEDNSYEIVDFCPPATGPYTICVSRWAFSNPTEFFGLAWTQDRDGRIARFRPQYAETTASDAVGPTAGNGAFALPLENPIAVWSGPGVPYVAIASLGSGVGLDLPGCRHTYGDLDALALLSLDPTNLIFLGFTGVTDASGRGATRLAVPNVQGLGGFGMLLSGITLDPSAPSGIGEIAEMEEVVLWDHAVDLALPDDGSALVDLGFAFPFYGGVWTQAFVNANGNLTFGQSDATGLESVAGFAGGPPRVAPFWDDLNPAAGGKVRVRRAGDRTVIEWVRVPQYASADANSVLVTLRANGRIEFRYGSVNLQDAIVGVSPGGFGGVTAETDLRRGSRPLAPGAPAYEQFTGIADAFDLAGLDAFRTLLWFERRDAQTFRFGIDGH